MALDDLTPPGLDETQEEITPTGWARWSEMLLAAAVIVIGIVILVETQQIRVVRAMSQVSPRAIPQIVGTGMIREWTDDLFRMRRDRANNAKQCTVIDMASRRVNSRHIRMRTVPSWKLRVESEAHESTELVRVDLGLDSPGHTALCR